MSLRKFLLPAKIVSACVVIGAAIWLGLNVVRADVESGWISSAPPQLSKTTDLPANQTPAFSNRDCTQLPYTTTTILPGGSIKTNNYTSCFVSTTRGYMGADGTPILYHNSSTGIGMVGYQNDNFVLQPIPNQGMTLSLTGASSLGVYALFYTDVYQHVTPQSDLLSSLQSYNVNAAPDFALRDKNGGLINVNPNTIAYSSNGSWMLVDAYSRGFLRINMATFDVTPFAPTLQNGSNDYGNHFGTTAISDDGRYAVIGSTEYGYLKTYDISTCSGPIPDDYSQPQACQYRDYWPDLSSRVPGFHSLSSVRFANDDNLNLALTYDWHTASASSFDAATYRLTAPGKAAHGIDYLALGDSFASGQGEFVYKDGTDTSTNTCHQSPLSYPFTIGAGLFNQYNSVACSGAVINDVINNSDSYNSINPQSKGKSDKSYDSEIYSNFLVGYRAQIQFVKTYQPAVVTLSIGGNDVGFSDIVTSCVSPFHLPTSGETCYATYDDQQRLIKAVDGLFPKLRDTYQAITRADPGVRLYVVGYPQIVTQGDCGDNVHLNPQEITFAQGLVSYLDSTIQRAADSAGVRYVDTQDALAGSRLCETIFKDIAVNGFTVGTDSGILGVKFIGSESFHPNVRGHQLLAEKIRARTDNLRQPMPAANPAILPPTSSDPAAQAILTDPTPSGNPVADIVVASTNLTPSAASAGTTIALAVDGTANSLKPNSSFQVLTDTTTTNLGNVASDASGSLSTQLVLPASLEPGYHTILVTGQNLAGQTITLYKIIYVSPAGTQTIVGDCGPVPPSGHDADSDGIDDACDPLIGDAPQYHYPIAVHLTGNSIQIGAP